MEANIAEAHRRALIPRIWSLSAAASAPKNCAGYRAIQVHRTLRVLVEATVSYVTYSEREWLPVVQLWVGLQPSGSLGSAYLGRCPRLGYSAPLALLGSSAITAGQ